MGILLNISRPRLRDGALRESQGGASPARGLALSGELRESTH
jgi:hypothetical protein